MGRGTKGTNENKHTPGIRAFKTSLTIKVYTNVCVNKCEPYLGQILLFKTVNVG